MVVKRNIDGHIKRTIEYLSQPFRSVDEMEFFTGNESYDKQEYNYYLWQSQLNQNYLDCVYIYNGIQNHPATLTGLYNGLQTFTCIDYTFLPTDVGREIKENINYEVSQGVANIVEFVSDHEVKINMLSPFQSTSLDSWILTTGDLVLPSLYFNKKVQTIVDGGIGQEYNVDDSGNLTLQYQGGFIMIGFKYVGLVKSLNLNTLTQDGTTMGFFKHISDVNIAFYNTTSVKIGTSLYRTNQFFVGPSNPLGKPPLTFSGVFNFTLQDNPSKEKFIYFVKDDYSSCNIQFLDINITYR
jgi:hypothetical protein